VVLGVGLGSDEFAQEYVITGEELDARRRGEMLDESLEILTPPGRASRFGIEASTTRWAARASCRDRSNALGCPCGSQASSASGARCSGLPDIRATFPIRLEHPDELAQAVSDLKALRSQSAADPAEHYDVAVELDPGSDPAPYTAAGATWAWSRSRGIRCRSIKSAA
jgi:hypothetical protein